MKILVAVDSLDYGKEMVALIENIGATTDAKLRIMTVIPSILAYTNLAVVPALVQELRDDAREDAVDLVNAMARQLKEAFPASDIDEKIVEGTPAHEILAMADQWKSDLIIVGSHCLKGMKKLLIGSVSQSVVANANCSVLVCRNVPAPTAHALCAEKSEALHGQF